MLTKNKLKTNKIKTVRSTIIIGMLLLHTFVGAGWAVETGELLGWGDDWRTSNIPTGSDFVAVAASANHNVALKSDGSLVSWGNDGSGQVSNTPSGNEFVAVSAGANHSIALKSDGSLIAWGYDNYGQVSDTPSGNNFVAVASGKQHNVALKSDGSLVSWGLDVYGQVSDTPAGNDFVAVAACGADGNHSAALKSDGSLVTWGYDAGGQLNNIPAGNDFVAVASGGYHDVALKSDGRLVSWGLDSLGQVSNTPTGNNFVAVWAGSYHSVALKSDGSLVAWGKDSYNQVSETPTGNDFVAAAAGAYHNLAIKKTIIPLKPTVSISATDASAGEPANDGYFTVSRTGDTSSSMRVYYSTSGSTASAGTDYSALPGYVDFSSGQTYAVIYVIVYDDSTVESSETVRLTISSSGAYDIGSPSYATVTIADDDVTPVTPIVTISATDSSAAEPANDGYFTVSRTGDTAGSLLVYYSTSGSTASSGSDYTALSGYVYIYAGQSSATIYVDVIDDSIVESSETVRLTISSNAAYNIGSPSYATVTIADDDQPPVEETTVTITAPDASAAEPANDGYFTVTRTGDTSSNLLVYYSTSGSTASSGYDYEAIPSYVYIVAGQSSATIPVVVIDDSAIEDPETVQLTIYNLSTYTVGSSGSATVTITDNDTGVPQETIVSISATDASAGEPANDGSFRISRAGDTSSSLLVYYSTSGSTASAGYDYASLPGYVYIYAGQTSATIPVDVIDDSTVESSETVRLTISSNAAYTVGSPSYATVTITDNDDVPQETPVVTITAPDAYAGEPADDGYFRISRTGDTSSSLLVYYSTSGSTASSGYDYEALPGYVYIPAGQSYAYVDVVVIDDGTVESSETVRLAVSSNAAYTVGSPSYATVTITDNDNAPPPPVNDAEQMMADTLTFFYASVDNGSLVAVGTGKNNLVSFKKMLETAYDQIVGGDYTGACGQLSDALSRCDGLPNPTDYVSGSATATLEAMIEEVMTELGC